ncbi:MAG: indole-3-glycerol phosphate synthase TrpC [Planctomycetaceae bacterium]|nr:indole-3-glycerol phosphate synthase TrpC [Planctomycetaceae bacterium]
MSNVLERIVATKRAEVARARQRRPLAELERVLASAPPVRDFVAALKTRHPMGLIAEVKRASPSAGLIRADFDPVQIARTYETAGAACISVLTDMEYFQGSLDYLVQIRAAVGIPVLRKDFIIDPYQIVEARVAGADCVLLIAECLDDPTLGELYSLTRQLGMHALIELYEPENLDRVLALNPPLVGVNNRDLKTFTTRLEHTVDLRRRIPEDKLVVGESGIHTREDVLTLQSGGVHAILVGESLMRADDIAAQVRSILGEQAHHRR